jgi:flagellar hook-associated protein 2
VRIAIVGDKPGANQALTITNDFGQTFTTTQTAQNARIVLDPGSSVPVPIESATNTFENVIQGLTLQAKGLTNGENVTVTIQTSSDKVKKSLTDLVDAYNAIADVISKQNTIDPKTQRGGPLLGDSTMVSLAQGLAGAFARAYGNGSVTNTGQLGLQVTRDGHLQLNEAALDGLLESDFEGVARFVAGPNAFADSFRQVLDNFVDPVAGALTSRVNGASKQVADLQDSITKAGQRLDDFEANLVRQFSSLEDTISQFQQQASFLTSFVSGQSR